MVTPCDIIACAYSSFVPMSKCEQDKIYQNNLEASVSVLKKLTEQWKDLSGKLTPVDPLRETLKSFRHKVPLSFVLIFSTYCRS